MIRHLLTMLCCCSLAPTAYAGAWLQPKGQGQFISQATYYSATQYYDFEGERKKQARFRKLELQPYVEYGLTDQLTIGGSAYAQTLSQSGTHNRGIADPEIFARTRVWHNETETISIQPLIKFPSRFSHDTSPRGGSKSTDAELSVLYGRNLHIVSNRDWMDSRTGYRMRNKGLSDQWRSDVALGLGVTDALTIIPALRSTVPISMTETAIYSENGDLDYALVKAELGAMYAVSDKQWLQAALSKDVYGIQTGAGTGISIGYGQKF